MTGVLVMAFVPGPYPGLIQGMNRDMSFLGKSGMNKDMSFLSEAGYGIGTCPSLVMQGMNRDMSFLSESGYDSVHASPW